MTWHVCVRECPSQSRSPQHMEALLYACASPGASQRERERTENMLSSQVAVPSPPEGHFTGVPWCVRAPLPLPLPVHPATT